MRLPPSLTALSLPAVAILLASCLDSSRLSAPTAPATGASPVSAKHGTTGSRILVSTNMGLNDGWLWSMDDDGTRIIYLQTGNVCGASWAPDGKRIVLSSSVGRANNLCTLYLMNDDGTGLTQLTHPAENRSDAFGRTVGKYVVFQRFDASDLTSSIWLVDPATGGETQLTFGANDTYPTGAPSGKLFAFVRGDDIYAYELATGALTHLTNTPGVFEVNPAWAPGGKQIAYTRFTTTGVTADLYVMNADGTGATQLTFTPDVPEYLPFWSPDGKRLAFTRLDPTAQHGFDVWVMDVDGTNQINLSPNTGNTDEQPAAWAR